MDSQKLLAQAQTIRAVEEALLELYRVGKVSGTIHTCIGQEFSAVAIGSHLTKGDSVFSNHRGHGHYLAITDDVDGLIAEILGTSGGPCKGIGGSQHLQRENYYSNGIQGGIAPVTLGLAQARKWRGKNEVSVVFLGDGTLGEGAVYESFNLAAKWALPILFVVEDNGISQSTPSSLTLAGSMEGRAEAFAIPSQRGNTWKWEDLVELAGATLAKVRSGAGPQMLIIDTYRLKGHSKGDDTRLPSEVQKFVSQDPLAGPLPLAIRHRVQDAVARAEKHPDLSGSTVVHRSPMPGFEPVQNPRGSGGKILNAGFKELFAKHPRAILIGEDVLSPYGGAFKISAGLSDEFPDRVLTTPVSEAAIAGLATGLALEGYQPIVEFMFGDFLGLAFDQIVNHAAKIRLMYGHEKKLPVIFRTPMGGRRGYGPTHSQSLEKHFMGVPGLKVAALNHFINPTSIYRHLLAHSEEPVLVIENKELYTVDLWQDRSDGFELVVSQEPLPTAHLRPLHPKIDFTLIGYGGMSLYLLEAANILFDEHDLIAQILCPTQLYPFQISQYAKILLLAPKVLVVEEGQSFAAFSSEILAQMVADPLLSKLRCARLGAAETVIPCSIRAERQTLPSAQDIVRACLERLR